MIETIITGVAALTLGSAGGYLYSKKNAENQKSKILTEEMMNIQQEINNAEKNLLLLEKKETEKEREIERKERDAEKKAEKIIQSAQQEIDQTERKLEKEIARLEEREKSLDGKFSEIENQRMKVDETKEELQKKKEELEKIIDEESRKLEEIAGLSKEAAKQKLLDIIEKTAENDLINKVHRMEERMAQEVDDKARNIIVHSIQRLASDVTTESTISQVELESDDMKGRIIGKEGRNINAFERTLGVNIIIDDTPNVVILSSFDPLRRHIAAEVLKELLLDGRIHPARIEEVMHQKQLKVDKMIQKLGEDAIFETGVTGVPPEIIKILGRLHFRTSYGQNVLRHSIECAFIAESIANMIGADAELSKKAGLLHDLGKTLSHEVGGKHALLSGEIARKFQLDEDLVHAIEAHHEDVQLQSAEAYIVQAADAISASRPGARRETSEKFIKRMVELEGIATSYKGVKKCYAMSAGREMWIFIDPQQINDLKASKLSWDIARRIESEVQYPGEVKVMIIRENRFVNSAK